VKKKEGAKEAAADVDLPVLIALGKQVRKLRMAAGLSQHQFAEAAGTSHTYIVSIEAGIPNVSVAMLDKMAKVLGISIAAFFPDAEDGTEHIDPVLSRMASELHRVQFDGFTPGHHSDDFGRTRVALKEAQKIGQSCT
jgi:transcriptional regulator with XRE-family HTH domain